jgi:hypothetical protein
MLLWACAVASPIPAAAPVMSATLPLKSNGLFMMYSSSAAILFVADLLHPVDVLSVQGFLDGRMSHRGGWRCPVPVLESWWEPNHIARTDLRRHCRYP